MVYLLAVAAALSNAMVSVLQRSAASEAPEDSTFSVRLILYLVRRPVWLFGILTMIAAFILQAAALHFGQISTVQPILTVELVFLLAILWAFFHNPIGRVEWTGALAIVAGLACFLLVSDPTSGSGTPDTVAWLAAAGATFLVAGALIWLARSGSKAKRAALFGAAAAVIWAFTAALIKTMTAQISQGWLHLFTHWPVYAVVAVGVTGLIVVQSAFQVGPLTASQPALIIVDPMASILIGVWLFHDRLASRAVDVAMEAAAMLVMFAGVFILSRSPIIIGVKSEAVGGATATSGTGPPLMQNLNESHSTLPG